MALTWLAATEGKAALTLSLRQVIDRFIKFFETLVSCCIFMS